VPWKTSNATSSEDKSGAAPPTIPLDLNINPEADPNSSTIPIAWKRLQFKHATANNGRRKGLQQHYVIQINLMATLATGDIVKVAEIQSGPIIVRGRSPRNFDSRKDVPLSEKKVEPKARTASDGGVAVKADPATTSPYRFYAMNAIQQPLDLPDWASLSQSAAPTNEPSHRPTKKPALLSPSTHHRPPVPKTRWKNEPSPSPSKSAHPHPLPIDLSLADDDHSRSHSSLPSSSHSHRFGDSSSPQLSASLGGKRKIGSSPAESADLLYEYFPLSLDDWMPPVDAIYRPHVVHHTIVPPDLKAQQVKNKTKRYFSADD